MKHLKFILLALGLTCFTASYAQTVQSYELTYKTQAGATKTTVDTTTDADTTYLYPSFGANNEYGDITYAWAVVPSITGTTTGTVVVQGSQTGTFARSGGSAANGDWVNLTSSTAEYTFSGSISGTTTIYGYCMLPNNQFKYTRLRYVTSGTQTSKITAVGGHGTNGCFLRKHN